MSRRVLLGSGQLIAVRIGGSIFSFGALLVIDRTLSVAEFGLYSYYFPLYLIAASAVDFGSFGIAVREIAQSPEREGEILRAVILFRLVVATLLVLLLALLGLQDRGRSLMLGLVAMHLLSLAPAALAAHFHAHLRFAAIAVPQFLGALLFAGACFALYRTGHHRAESYLAAYGAGVVFQSLAIFLLGAPGVRLRGPLDFRLTLMLSREMAPLGIAIGLHTTYTYLDSVLIRQVAGDVAVGEYNYAYRLFTFGLAVPQLFALTLLPVLSRLVSAPSVLPRVVQRTTFYMGAVALPAAALTPGLGRSLMATIWGHVSDTSVACLVVLAGAGVCVCLSAPIAIALIAMRRQRIVTWISLLAVVVKVVVGVILIRRFDIIGAATATLGVELLVLVAMLRAFRARTGASGVGVILLRPIAAAIVVGSAAGLAPETTGPWPLVIASVLLVAGILLGGLLPFDLRADAPTISSDLPET